MENKAVLFDIDHLLIADASLLDFDHPILLENKKNIVPIFPDGVHAFSTEPKLKKVVEDFPYVIGGMGAFVFENGVFKLSFDTGATYHRITSVEAYEELTKVTKWLLGLSPFMFSDHKTFENESPLTIEVFLSKDKIGIFKILFEEEGFSELLELKDIDGERFVICPKDLNPTQATNYILEQLVQTKYKENPCLVYLATDSKTPLDFSPNGYLPVVALYARKDIPDADEMQLMVAEMMPYPKSPFVKEWLLRQVFEQNDSARAVLEGLVDKGELTNFVCQRFLLQLSWAESKGREVRHLNTLLYPEMPIDKLKSFCLSPDGEIFLSSTEGLGEKRMLDVQYALKSLNA